MTLKFSSHIRPFCQHKYTSFSFTRQNHNNNIVQNGIKHALSTLISNMAQYCLFPVLTSCSDFSQTLQISTSSPDSGDPYIPHRFPTQNDIPIHLVDEYNTGVANLMSRSFANLSSFHSIEHTPLWLACPPISSGKRYPLFLFVSSPCQHVLLLHPQK